MFKKVIRTIFQVLIALGVFFVAVNNTNAMAALNESGAPEKDYSNVVYEEDQFTMPDDERVYDSRFGMGYDYSSKRGKTYVFNFKTEAEKEVLIEVKDQYPNSHSSSYDYWVCLTDSEGGAIFEEKVTTGTFYKITKLHIGEYQFKITCDTALCRNIIGEVSFMYCSRGFDLATGVVETIESHIGKCKWTLSGDAVCVMSEDIMDSESIDILAVKNGTATITAENERGEKVKYKVTNKGNDYDNAKYISDTVDLAKEYLSTRTERLNDGEVCSYRFSVNQEKYILISFPDNIYYDYIMAFNIVDSEKKVYLENIYAEDSYHMVKLPAGEYTINFKNESGNVTYPVDFLIRFCTVEKKNLVIGKEYTLESDIGDCKWTSSNPKIVSLVSDKGSSIAVKSLKKGTASIVAENSAGRKVTYKLTVSGYKNDYSNVKKEYDKVTVTKKNPLINEESFRFDLSSYSGNTVGKTYTFPFTIKEDAELLFYTESTSMYKYFDYWICVADNSDNVIFEEKVTENSFYKIKKLTKGTYKVMLTSTAMDMPGSVSGVVVCYTTLERKLSIGEALSLASPIGLGDWTSSDESVVVVRGTNKAQQSVTVVGNKKGTATVTVKNKEGKKINYVFTVSGNKYDNVSETHESTNLAKENLVDTVEWLRKGDVEEYPFSVDAEKYVLVSFPENNLDSYLSFCIADSKNKIKYEAATLAGSYHMVKLPKGKYTLKFKNISIIGQRDTNFILRFCTINQSIDGAQEYEYSSDIGECTWETSDSSVVSLVSKKGSKIKLIAKKKGTATVTAVNGDGRKVTYKITVKDTPIITNVIFGYRYSSRCHIVFEVANQSGKTIKYVKFNMNFYNRVGDLLENDIGNYTYESIKEEGPQKAWTTDAYYVETGFFNSDIMSVGIKSVTIEYTDGTSATFKLNKRFY